MNIDWSVLQWIHDTFTCGFLDYLMPKITLLGDMGAIWIVAAVVLICTKKYRKQGVILLAGLAIGVLVGNVALKHLIARPRPCWLDTSVQLLIANPTDYSFPSGHTLSSVIGATILTLTNRKFGWAAIPVAALIAFSRLYLYVHFPSDILGAVFFGLIIGISVFYVGNATWKWLGKKLPQSL
ncbi:MAG: phosphatase PAP2 family protein [Oscillospiraceae bacterium]|nr:phosphatase PAP2 family protein [Oscillospiraceae bacterium]